jgi:hypothetical protein
MSAGLLAFLVLTASLFLTAPVRALAIRVGMVDLPGPRSAPGAHSAAGLAMYLGDVGHSYCV